MDDVLVLRPEPGASATAERARALGLAAIAIPLFEVEPVTWQAPEPLNFDGLLLTSANAIRHGGEELNHVKALRVYAVGAATAQAARSEGFDVAATGDSDLAYFLAAIDPGLRLLHLAGEHRTATAQPRQQITTLTVYRSQAVEDAALRPARVALIHSPRAGRRFAELAMAQDLDNSAIAIAAISANAAAAVGAGWASVAIAPAPTDEALLALAARLCNNPAPR